MNEKLQQFERKMQKSYDNLLEEFGAIRAGRANPHVLDRITVEYYGVPTALQQVANVSVPEPRMIQIQPWEPLWSRRLRRRSSARMWVSTPPTTARLSVLSFRN